MALLNRKQEILEHLRAQGQSAATGIAHALGITRQALHRYMAALLKEKQITRIGHTRGALYRLAEEKSPPLLKKTYLVQGLEESTVLTQIELSFSGLMGENAKKIFRYAFTELLNNAIDHSEAKKVTIELMQNNKAIGFTIRDAGIGAFKKIQKAFKLQESADAANELLKGKLTTAPARHSGEGIFFSSKAVTRFSLESGDLRLIVDNKIGDVTIAKLSPPFKGTVVSAEIDRQTKTNLSQIFDEYTDEKYGFSKTRIHVHLLEYGKEFVSRSEAKRLVNRLDSFQEVVLDFHGVESVGQGFADEVFRVFAQRHPSIRLKPVRMVHAVAFMVKRALAAT